MKERYLSPRPKILPVCFLAVWMLLLLTGGTRADDAMRPVKIIVNRVGFTSNEFPGTATRDAEIAIDYWFKLMSDRQNLAQIPNTKVYTAIEQMYYDLRQGELDIVVILTQDFLAISDEVALDPFSIATRNDESLTRWGVFVSATKRVQSLEQLRGGKIIFDQTEGADFGKIWFETLLLRKGLNPDEFFVGEMVEKASRAILPVYFGQADACVAPMASYDNMVEMNPAVGKEVVALEISPEMAPGLICFTPQIDPSRKPDILNTLITMHQDPQGQQVLNLFRRDRVLLFHESQIEPVRQILEENRRLRERLRSTLSSDP